MKRTPHIGECAGRAAAYDDAFAAVCCRAHRLTKQLDETVTIEPCFFGTREAIDAAIPEGAAVTEIPRVVLHVVCLRNLWRSFCALVYRIDQFLVQQLPSKLISELAGELRSLTSVL